MATPTLTPNSKEEQDDRYNPALLNEKEDRAFAGIADNYSKDADDTQENANIARANAAEANPAEIPKNAPGFKFTGTGNANNENVSIQGKIWGFTRKKGATIGIVGGLGLVSILISMLSGVFSMLLNVQSNSIDTNDSRSTIMDRRLAKWIDKKTAGGGDDGCNLTKYKCRAGLMPNKMLSRMSTQDINPLDEKGNKIVITSEDGYPDKNPAKYEITVDGKKKIISSADLAKEYKNNPAFRGAFKRVYSMRYKAWVGKTIKRIFYDSFKLRTTGGVASKDNNLTPETVDKEVDARLDSSSSKDSDTSREGFRQRFQQLVDKTANKVKRSKGSPTLLLGTGYCTAVGMPGFIAGAYRTIQVAQILVLINDTVLSPAGKLKAGDITASEATALGNVMTEQVNGRSALDSPILLSAMGVNKSKTAASKYAPGYEAYSSPTIQKANGVNTKSKGFCNKIMSPEAAYTATAVEGAISAGTAGTGAVVIGAIRGVVTLFAAIKGVEAAVALLEETGVTDKVADLAFKTASGFVGNYTEGARGEKLGDALGIGIFAYFSMSGLRSGSGVLKKNQIVAYNQAAQDVENQYREEAIATLSPFDASSKYTFMGSFVSKLSLSGVNLNNPAQSLRSVGSLVLGTPSALLSPAANAATTGDDAKNRCDHNEMFDIQDDIGVNPAGYPCVGVPAEYLDMPIDEVQGIVANATDEDTGEVKPAGEVAPEDDIASIQADCGDGDLEAIGGCTITNKKRAAQSIYQYDKNVSDILDGSDDQTLVDSGDDFNDNESSASGDVKWPLDKKWWTKDKGDWLDAHSKSSGTWTSGVDSLAVDISIPSGQPVYAMLGGKVSKNSLSGHGLEITSQVDGGTLEIAYAHGPRTSPSKTSYEAGDKIMTSGQLGNATGPHLHIDMAFNGKGVCPQLVFPLIDSGEPINWGELASKSKAPC